ncbi:MAG: ATP-binding cassette domain-containing protein [Myxococcota bacterium]
MSETAPSSDGLVLERFGFAFGEQAVAADLSMHLTRPGLCILMGAAGCGKSALLRTLAGLNDAQPSFRRWGRYEIDGAPALPEDRVTLPGLSFELPVLVRQHHHLSYGSVLESLCAVLPDRDSLSKPGQRQRIESYLSELGLNRLSSSLDELTIGLSPKDQRLLGIARACLANPPAVLVDEPMSGLDDEASVEVIELLRHLSSTTSVLVVTHHRQRARQLGGTLILIAGGRTAEIASTEEFMAGPSTELGRRFLDTSGPHLIPSQPPPPVPTPVPPRFFCWLIEGSLAGLPRPGVVQDLATDLDGLRGLGVTRLVCLEEEVLVPLGELSARGITLQHFPIQDMDCPPVDAFRGFAEELSGRLAAGEVVAVHCLAGLGRTGTVLAAYLAWTGVDATDAIERVRGLRSQMIQTTLQEKFVHQLNRKNNVA